MVVDFFLISSHQLYVLLKFLCHSIKQYVCDYSLLSGADVSCTDGHGQTPLHLANSRLRVLHTNYTVKTIPERIKKEITQVTTIMMTDVLY